MKRFIIRRVLPFVLSISILFPCFTVLAGAADGVMYDPGSVADWNTVAISPASGLIDSLASALGIPSVTANLERAVFWALVNSAVGNDVGEVAYLGLKAIAERYNSAFNVSMRDGFFSALVQNTSALFGETLCQIFGFDGIYFNVVQDGEVWRIQDTGCTGFWVVNQQGAYPYAWVDDRGAESSGGDYWRPANEVLLYLNNLNSVDKDVRNQGGKYTDRGTLEAVKQHRINQGDAASIKKIPGFDMMAINKSGYYWCNADGQPYFCFPDDNVAVEQDRPLTEVVPEDGFTLIDVNEGINVGIDMDNMIVVLPDATIQPILDVTYNPHTFTYDVTTYDINNYDITYNYTFEYHVQYTYVTYIGETSDFDAYKCYYQLPDGRNSADLTKEELEQLNVGIDVVEYSRSTDDVRLRALYHFDGDTKDSSYWNHLSDFEWSNAPSITYMESDPFGGALYLDGNVRSTLDFYLPTDLGSGDFTIQFRYYQGQKIEDDSITGLYLNASEDLDEWYPTHDDSAQCVLNFNGDAFGYLRENGEFSKAEKYPVGSWFEICLTRQDNTITYYLNGQPLIITDEYADFVFNDRLTFMFKGGTVAYAMIDELRVLNFAIASGKESDYEPTAVPHDTNLALVLPNDKVAYADEYWTFESSHANLLEPYGLDDWTTMAYDPSAYLRSFDAKFGYQGNSWVTSHKFFPDDLTKLYAYYNSDVIDLNFSHQGASFDYVYEDDHRLQYLSNLTGFAQTSSFAFPFACIYIPIRVQGVAVLADGDYTFSVVLSTGAVRSRSFSISNGVVSGLSSVSRDGLRVTVGGNNSSSVCLSVGFNPLTDSVPSNSVVYMELIRGSETDLTAEFHEDVAILDKDDQFKPTLAVRTDLEITDYQIGGVRPTIPEKGLVYAMVESGYITSLQIYNGQAWEACDGRIWTGERWIPYSSYNVITLQDMYDIVDATPGYEYIYTESGFWAWWQRSWNEFTTKLFSLLGGGTGDDGDLDLPAPEADPENEDALSFLEFVMLLINSGKSVLLGFRTLFSGVVSSVPGAVQVITGAFEPGGIAVGVFDGTYKDPDLEVVAVMDLDSLDYYQTEEVLDPWRYR